MPLDREAVPPKEPVQAPPMPPPPPPAPPPSRSSDEADKQHRLEISGAGDSMDALDALVAELNEDMAKSDAASVPSRPAKDKRGSASELKCGIAPLRAKQTWTPEDMVDGFQFAVELDDSPSVYCSPSATLMSVQYPGSPIAKAVDLDDSDTSVVFLTGRPASARRHRVRFECHGPTSHASHVPQAPGRRHSATGSQTKRPLGCTMVAYGGA
jgi:hypothetical protein